MLTGLAAADDLDYGDLGAFGARAIETPSLDRMAAEGLRLTGFQNVAANDPCVVGDLTARIAEKLKSFPDEIPEANTGLLK